jgi:hypothetical protein
VSRRDQCQAAEGARSQEQVVETLLEGEGLGCLRLLLDVPESASNGRL